MAILRLSPHFLIFSLFLRYAKFNELTDSLERSEPGGLDAFTRSYKSFGIHVNKDGSVFCQEWCPGVQELYLWGEFSE